jgi:GTP cyclohydrolase I
MSSSGVTTKAGPDCLGDQATPQRWLQALIDMTDGYNRDPKVQTIFPRECLACEEGAAGEQTVEGPIAFVSLV